MAIKWFLLECLLRVTHVPREAANSRIWVHQDDVGLMVPPSSLMVAHCQTNPSTSHGSHTPKTWKRQSLRAAVLLFRGDPTMDTAPFAFNSFQDENQSFSLPSLLLVHCNPPKIPTAVFPCLTLLCWGKSKYFQILIPLLRWNISS